MYIRKACNKYNKLLPSQDNLWPRKGKIKPRKQDRPGNSNQDKTSGDAKLSSYVAAGMWTTTQGSLNLDRNIIYNNNEKQV